jgi:site-specific DNA recombinase
MQRAALYARVSTAQQAEEATIESQVAALETYAAAHDYQVSAEHYFVDQGVSGARLDRPALDRLRDVAAGGQFATVICLAPDRLARNYAHQWVLLDELRRLAVQVVFVNQLAAADAPEAQLLLGMQGLFAEYERTQITERLRRGKLHRMRQGQLAPGVPPYGYRYIPVSEPQGGRWEIHLDEAAVVRLLFHWYTEEGLTITQLVERLNQDLTATPPHGKRWRFSTVQGILKQPAYTGQAHFNRTSACQEAIGRPKRSGRGVRRTATHPLRPPEEWIAVAVPPLLPQALWTRAQERLVMNQQFAPRNNSRHFYLLRSLLVCDVCGRTLCGRNSGGALTYYCSNQGKQRNPDVPPHSRSIRAAIIEPLVWDAVCRLLRDPALLADAWQDQAQDAHADPDELQRIQAHQRRLQGQWTRLLDAFQTGLIDQTELAQRKQRLDAQRTALAEQEQRLLRLQQHYQVKEQMLHDFAAFCHQIEASLSNPSPQLQQEVIRLLVDHVVVGSNEIVIKHIVPTADDCRLLPGRR